MEKTIKKQQESLKTKEILTDHEIAFILATEQLINTMYDYDY